MSKRSPEKVLVVENDPVVSDLIARQALQSAGYTTRVEESASAGILAALEMQPDLIISSMDLEGLSGKDLMVALTAQDVTAPVIALARKGNESRLVQYFRLGAADLLLLPVREAEVISAVERVLQQVRERREREQLSLQIQRTNQELQARVREMTVLGAIGKAVTSLRDQSLLFQRMVESAVSLAQADLGYMLQLDEASRAFYLVAQKNLPASLAGRINQVWDDGISSMVAMSGYALSMHGAPLQQHRISSLGSTLLIVPVRVQNQVLALLAVLRRQERPFSAAEQGLLEAVADYAGASLVNARLFRALEERVSSLQASARQVTLGQVSLPTLPDASTNLPAALKKALARHAAAARQAGVTLSPGDLPAKADFRVDPAALDQALDAMLAGALGSARRGETLSLVLENDGEKPRLMLRGAALQISLPKAGE